MGLSSSLYTATSGLQSNAQAMTVTGNNIANSNTVGYKSSSTIFSDLLAENIASSSGNSQVGRGTQVQTVQTSFTQGGFEATGNSTDVAIEGDGFFTVSPASSDTMYYTRNGSFTFDADGYLVTADGYRVQGTPYNDDGELVEGTIGDIQLDLVAQVEAKQTENVTLQSNLDASAEEPGAFDIADPTGTSNYSTTIVIYDSLGTSHNATCYYTKTADLTWEYNITVDSDDLDAAQADAANDETLVCNGVLTFDDDGILIAGAEGVTDALQWNNGADAGQTLTYNFETTQFDSSSTVFAQDQDGYASGEVSDVSIESDGTVNVLYSNGEIIPAGILSLAAFANPDGLDQAGSSLYLATSESGTPTVGYPGESLGSLVSQSLELSNVDLSTEFVDLITIQNGYSANSRVITTVDEMLQELLSMTR